MIQGPHEPVATSVWPHTERMAWPTAWHMPTDSGRSDAWIRHLRWSMPTERSEYSEWDGSTMCTSACRIVPRPPGGTASISDSSPSTSTTSGRPDSRVARSRSRPMAEGRCWRCSRRVTVTRWFRSRPVWHSASTRTASWRSPARCPAGSTIRGRASRAHRSRGLRHVLGVQSRRPVGKPVRAQLLRLRPGEGRAGRGRTQSKPSATGLASSIPRTSTPHRRRRRRPTGVPEVPAALGLTQRVARAWIALSRRHRHLPSETDRGDRSPGMAPGRRTNPTSESVTHFVVRRGSGRTRMPVPRPLRSWDGHEPPSHQSRASGARRRSVGADASRRVSRHRTTDPFTDSKTASGGTRPERSAPRMSASCVTASPNAQRAGGPK